MHDFSKQPLERPNTAERTRPRIEHTRRNVLVTDSVDQFDNERRNLPGSLTHSGARVTASLRKPVCRERTWRVENPVERRKIPILRIGDYYYRVVIIISKRDSVAVVSHVVVCSHRSSGDLGGGADMNRDDAIRTERELSGHFWAEGHPPPGKPPGLLHRARSGSFLRRCARRLQDRLHAADNRPERRIAAIRDAVVPEPARARAPSPHPRRSVAAAAVDRRASLADNHNYATVDDGDDDRGDQNVTTPPPLPPPRRSIKTANDGGVDEGTETSETRPYCKVCMVKGEYPMIIYFLLERLSFLHQ